MKFPGTAYDDPGRYLDDYAAAIAAAMATVPRPALQAAAQCLNTAIKAGNTIYACGNGGSAAIANHLVCDCVKGVQTDTVLKPRVHSLSANPAIVTAIANDIAYDQVFSYQLASFARPGDVLIAISSSGRSPNIINAIACARAHQVTAIAMTGFTGGRSLEEADIGLHVAANNYGVIEDVHQALMHVLAQYLRQANFADPGLIATRVF